jgi:ribosomal protein S6--L-glutamate ligase
LKRGQSGDADVKILMLTREPGLYSHRRLAEAAGARGHHLSMINPLHCYMNITSRQPQVYHDGERLGRYDAVIPRIGASVTFYGLAVLRQFEMMGVYALNESVAINRSRDKLRSLQLLARDGIGLPATAFAHDPKVTAHVLDSVGGAPVVIKLLEGTQGIGVVLADTQRSAKSIIEAFREVNVNILVQEFIKEAGGSDVRAFVVGGKVAAAMKRTSAKGDFRSNVHRGGTAEAVKLTRAERSTALRAARSMGLSVCGVDLLRAERGPVVIEVNSSPGLEGIEGATGVDIAGEIIKYIEENARPGRSKTRGKG